MKFLFKTLFRIIFIVIAIAVIYHYRQNWIDFIYPPKPCSKPLTYSIGSFDPRFGITKEDFIKDIVKAESIWEKASGKNLFEYSDAGTLKVNLVYDYRQQATDQLKKVGVSITSDKSVYDSLKIKYDSEKQDYTNQKSILDQKIADYTTQKTEYEKQVAYWNSQGGAPKAEYQTLQNQKDYLNQQMLILNQDTADLNALSEELNNTTNALNAVAKKLNIKVTDYNTIGSSTGEEFKEGEYVSDKDGVRINVYQFDTNDKLVRLLEHELGHAIGLNHVEDPQAIMYRLNSSTNQTPTADDIAELKRVCTN